MKHHLLIIILQLAATGADAWRTDANMTPRGIEQNPLSAPFVRTRPSRILYFGASATIKIALPIALRRHGHDRLATVAEWAGIADNAGCAIYSWRQSIEKKQ
jgi:hypothetical protein